MAGEDDRWRSSAGAGRPDARCRGEGGRGADRGDGDADAGEKQRSARRHPNALGIWGWLGGGRWGIERYAYALHRLSGLAILLYLLMHVFVTALRVRGVYLWDEGQFFDNPAFKAGEFLVFVAFAYHAFNGVRLVLIELGIAVGRPFEPVYPYKTSLNVQRPLLVAMMVLAAITLIAGGIEFLGFVE